MRTLTGSVLARLGAPKGRRGSIAAGAVALTTAASLLAAAPASADTNTYADAVGEADAIAAVDITTYTVQLTGSALSLTFNTRGSSASPFRADFGVWVHIDTNDDSTEDYEAFLDSSGTSWRIYRSSGFDHQCDAAGATTISSASMTIPASCIGSPSQVGVAIEVYSDGGWDEAPSNSLRGYSAPVGSGPDTGPTTAPQVAVYRFWSPGFNNAHFFTTNETEAEDILYWDDNWSFEGTAFSAIAAQGGTCPEGAAVHRFYSARFQSHFYTQNEAEKNAIVANDRNWSYEGVSYCAYTTATTGTIPLYRFWSPRFGKHFFTANQGEADHIRAVDTNWNYEGVAYYVLP